VGHFEHKFQGEGGSSTNEFWHQKTRVPGLSRGVVCVILCLAVLIQYRRVTDAHTHTHRQTDTQWWLLPVHCLHHAGNEDFYDIMATNISTACNTELFMERYRFPTGNLK